MLTFWLPPHLLLAMKIFTKKLFSTKIGLIIFFAGVANLFFPHISGWSDIVFPQFALIWLLPYLLWKLSFASCLGLSVINFIVLLFLKVSTKEKLSTLSFPIVLTILFLSIYPNFATEKYLGAGRRVSFFALGGKTRVYWAGGIENIRNNALSLLTEQPDDEGFVSSESWSNSLKKLGAYAIRIDNQTQSVLIYIPKANYFDSDQFVYFITYDKNPATSVLQRDGYRFWKLGEGVYFFETW